MKNISKFLVILILVFSFAFGGIFSMQNFKSYDNASAINETEILDDTENDNENLTPDEDKDDDNEPKEDEEIVYQTLIVNFNGANQSTYMTQVKVGDTLPNINVSARTGYLFKGFGESEDSTNVIDLSTFTMPNNALTIYAIWERQTYSLSFHSNSNEQFDSLNLYYNDQITLPSVTEVSGKNFLGWFTDSEFKNQFIETTMPDRNVELYAKWANKQVLTINKTAQTQTLSEDGNKFSNFSGVGGFEIEYKIDGVWTKSAPTKCGTYDVKITRAEDSDYVAFETIIDGGLIINGPEINLTFYIVVLFVFSAIVLALIVIVRILKKMKKRMVIASLVPIFSVMIPMEQLVLLIVSGVLALVFLLLLVYEIVSLHNTIPLNRQNDFTDDSENVDNFNNLNGNEIGKKYSAEDVEKLLTNDTFKPNKKEFATKSFDNEPYESAINKVKQKKEQSKDDFIEPDDDYVYAREKNGIKSRTISFSDTEEIYSDVTETSNNKK